MPKKKKTKRARAPTRHRAVPNNSTSSSRPSLNNVSRVLRSSTSNNNTRSRDQPETSFNSNSNAPELQSSINNNISKKLNNHRRRSSNYSSGRIASLVEETKVAMNTLFEELRKVDDKNKQLEEVVFHSSNFLITKY